MRELVGRAYASLFARPGAKPQAVNHALLHLALRGMGYNNGWQLDRSGEAWFLRQVLGSCSDALVVDVGANRGDYSRQVLKSSPTAEVLAFEPLQGCFEQLDLLERSTQRFDYRSLALSAAPGRQLLHYGDNDSEWASLSSAADLPPYAAHVASNEIVVPVSTLDIELPRDNDSLFPAVEILKIDVEGYELEVLAGAKRLIDEAPPRWVQIEWNLHQLYRGHTLRAVAELLPGYWCYQLLPGRRGVRLVDVNRPEANVYCYGNFVFSRDGGPPRERRANRHALSPLSMRCGM